MLAHLIYHKGKGRWVMAVPLICGIVLFSICDIAGVDTKFARPACFFLSAAIIWFVDAGHHLILYGKNSNKGQNTLYWIDMKYWAILLALAGAISLAAIN
ncbi:MAG: hypothetical protein WC615_20120 [Mucilaginibacter sp.]|uniref:hypothetical protein n=1 Tax=Mucilaginibacter sp. TaxID=1882438 RepID=UPI0035615CAF